MKDFKTGDVLNVRHPFKWSKPFRYISATIRFFTKCYYNHSAIIVSNWGKVYVAEAASKGIIVTPFEDWKTDLEYSVYRPKFMVKEKLVARKIMCKQGYTGYDFSGTLFHQLVYQVSNVWIGRKGKKSEKRQYCSEYIAWIYQEYFPEYWKVAPDDIYKRTDLFDEKYKTSR